MGFVNAVSPVSDFMFQVLYSGLLVSCFRLRISIFLFVVADFTFCVSRFFFFSCQLSGFRFPVLLFGFTASHDTFLLASFRTLVFCLHKTW